MAQKTVMGKNCNRKNCNGENCNRKNCNGCNYDQHIGEECKQTVYYVLYFLSSNHLLTNLH